MSWINRGVMAGAVFVAGVLLTGCASDGFTRVKTTDGYLSETKMTLPERVSADIGRVVFIRKDAQKAVIPTVFLNERVIGSLPPQRYSETLVCPGAQTLRIGTRADAVLAGQNVSLNVQPGATNYIQIIEDGKNNFTIRQLSEQQAKELSQGLQESHIINRHQPICNAPIGVIKQINLAADALFKFNQAQMLPAGQASVKKLVSDIKTLDAKVEQIRIVGHTDRLGSDAYNDRLSLARAKAVAEYMKQEGLNVAISTDGQGKRQPVTQGCMGTRATPTLIACLQPDRRVSIELLGSTVQFKNVPHSSK